MADDLSYGKSKHVHTNPPLFFNLMCNFSKVKKLKQAPVYRRYSKNYLLSSLQV